MALLKHIDARQSPSRSHESLLHTGRIDGIPTMQHSTMVQQSDQNRLMLITKNICDEIYADISIFRGRSYMWILAYLEKEVITVVHKAPMGT